MIGITRHEQPQLERGFHILLLKNGIEESKTPIEPFENEPHKEFILRVSVELAQFNNDKENHRMGLVKKLI